MNLHFFRGRYRPTSSGTASYRLGSLESSTSSGPPWLPSSSPGHCICRWPGTARKRACDSTHCGRGRQPWAGPWPSPSFPCTRTRWSRSQPLAPLMARTPGERGIARASRSQNPPLAGGEKAVESAPTEAERTADVEEPRRAPRERARGPPPSQTMPKRQDHVPPPPPPHLPPPSPSSLALLYRRAKEAAAGCVYFFKGHVCGELTFRVYGCTRTLCKRSTSANNLRQVGPAQCGATIRSLPGKGTHTVLRAPSGASTAR